MLYLPVLCTRYYVYLIGKPFSLQAIPFVSGYRFYFCNGFRFP